MREIIKEEVIEKVEKLLGKEVQYAKYGNGTDAPYRRMIDNEVEFTLVGSTEDFQGAHLYVGEVGATVSRLKEGRNESNLMENGERTKWAALYANNIRSKSEMFLTF